MIFLIMLACYALTGFLIVRISYRFLDEPILPGSESRMLPLAVLTWPMQLFILLTASNEIVSHRRSRICELEFEKKKLLADCSIGGPDIPRILMIEKEIESLQNRA